MFSIEKKLKKHPNFWSIIKFPKPPEWLYTRYMEVRESNVYDNRSIMQQVSNEDIYRALLILSLRDIMMNDTTLSMNRILLHIKNEYDLKISKSQIRSVVNDSKQLITKIREDAIEL